ncbi:MAG: response regulator [bacterium]|nr:response regulator [bacterium]
MKMNLIEILIVEDNPDHITLIMHALKDNKVVNNIHVAENGELAMDYLFHRGKFQDEKSFPLPNLILLDVKLPKLDGFEVLKAIKQDLVLKKIPVVMLTTSDKDEEIARGYSEGANSYVTKPVDFNEFRRKIKNLDMYWALVSELPT